MKLNFNISNLKKLDSKKRVTFSNSLREYLIQTISKTGGHIGANLSTIELTLAMHYVFDSPKDSFIFDTGHQGYTHKLMTKRSNLFKTLNKNGGMSRFLSRSESRHDIIDASHAGTAISIGSGIAYSNFIKKLKSNTLVVVGDGSMVEGMSFEALNFLFELPKKTKMILVINDNEMAIAKNVGGLKEVFGSHSLSKSFFNKFGLDYYFEKDGNDINKIIKTFKKAKRGNSKSVIHVKTQKGFGLKIAEKHPYKMHFSLPFDIENVKSASPTIIGKTMSVIISEFFLKNKKYFTKYYKFITPGTPYASNLEPLINNSKNFVLDLGMAEQHSVGFSVGMHLGGLKPILFIQSTFLQRAFDQLIHDVSFMKVPLTIFCVRSGLAGHDSPTHHGIYDLAYLKSIPNLKIYSPSSNLDLSKKLEKKFIKRNDNTKFEIILLPYEPLKSASFYNKKIFTDFDLFYKSSLIKSHSLKNMLIVTHVNQLDNSIKLGHKIVEADSLRVEIVCVKNLKPFNLNNIHLENYNKIVVIEEYSSINCIYSDVLSLINQTGKFIKNRSFNLGDKFIEPGDKNYLENKYSLNFNKIYKNLKKSSFIV